MKKEDKLAYGIVALGICIGLPVFLYAINRHSPSPVATQAQPAAPEAPNTPQPATPQVTPTHEASPNTANEPSPSAPSSASVPQTGLPAIEPSATDTALLALKLESAATAILAKEDVGPFILKYNPSYNSAEVQRLSESLWNSSSGTVKTTIRNPKLDVYIVLSKASGSPSAVGFAFPINKSGWISIPPEFIARMIKPDKPASEKTQAGLNQYYRLLSSQLYATGNCSGLLQMENGNAFRLDIKEDPEFPENLIFKTTFLPSQSYQVSDFSPDMVLAWQEGASVQTISHGKPRSDGWSTFEIARSTE
jgi:hypothetical protein